MGGVFGAWQRRAGLRRMGHLQKVIWMMHRPRLSGRLVAGWTVGLTAALMVLRLQWVEPWLRAQGRLINGRPIVEVVPEGLGALPFAGVLAFGLAVVIGLAWANCKRWRAVLRPNRGRVIGALILGFVTPVAVYSWTPWIIGVIWLTLGLSSLQEGMLDVILFGVAMILGAAVPWYPVACLIVSGIHGRVMRVAVFALMFWAAYAAILLAVGTHKFTL